MNGWLNGMTVVEAARFAAKVDHHGDPVACWLWTASVNVRTGYPQVKFRGRVTTPYRVSYETTVGPVGDGLELDHLCSQPLCVNPAHLDPVTHLTNLSRSRHPVAVAMRTNTCIHGHDFTAENTRIRRNGTRVCKECARRRVRSSRSARRTSVSS